MMTSILNNKKISRAFAAAFIVMCLCLLPTKVGVCALVFGVTFKFLKLSVANRCAILFAGLLLMTFIFGSGFDIFVKIAQMHGILRRSVEPFPDIAALLK